jgi:hypothetical protein
MDDGTPRELACSECGTPADPLEPCGASGVPWTWSVGEDAAGSGPLCADCTRAHARSIEAKLDHKWW